MQDLEAATREDANNARAWSWRAAIHMCRRITKKAREDCLPAEARIELYAVGCVAYSTAPRARPLPPSRSLAGVCQNADAPPEVKVWF